MKKRMLACLAGALVALVALAAAGCGGGGAEAPGEPAGAAGTVNIYIWSAYLPEEVLDEFTDRTGIKYNVDLYDSNEALLEKLQSGVSDYDIVVPSDYMVKILAQENLIQTVDHGRLPNMKHLDARFLDRAFDRGNRYSIPYFWGTTGIGYNREKVTEPVTSWKIMFDEKYKGRILMLDDMRECFGATLKMMGKSLNETDPAVLAQAADMLKKQKSLVQTYNSGDFANILAAGDVDLAHGYNGQIAEVVAADPDRLAYVVPEEGGTFWMDNLCIPAEARHLEAAYAFLNFVMEPEVNAKIVNGVSYASPNREAKQFIDPAILEDTAIYPPDEVLDRCEFIEDVGETTTLLDQYWTEIKAQ